jgi:hypothetical protein
MFRKFSIQSLCILGIILSACSPDLPAPTFTPTATPEPTLTSTPLPTATITLTPAPSFPADFPPEFQEQIGDADFELRGDHMWVTMADGIQQDAFQIESDGTGWRYSDAKLIASAPNQEWWEKGIMKGNDFDQRDIYIIFPEPDVVETSTIIALDGTKYEFEGVKGILPDENDKQVIQAVFVPTKGWANGALFWKMAGRCEGATNCDNGFAKETQYRGQFYFHKLNQSQYPIINHMIKVNQAQGFNDWITKMLQKEVNQWPEDLILFISYFDLKFPLQLDF